jgi:hypothetical protein
VSSTKTSTTPTCGGRRGTAPPSKNPAAFGITLHVDDSEGVRMEGEAHGFEVVVVTPQDGDWVKKVLLAVDKRQPRPTGAEAESGRS